MSDEIEHIRAALRGKHLPTLAREMDVPIPTIDMFVNERARLAPGLLPNLARILARQQNTPAPRSEEEHDATERARLEMHCGARRRRPG